MTVHGLKEASELGITLPHEHVLIGHIEVWETWLTDPVLAQNELSYFATNRNALSDVTQRTLVELSSRGLRWERPMPNPPDWLTNAADYPNQLSNIAQQTGVNMIMGSSYYKRDWSANVVTNQSVDVIKSNILRDLLVGVDGSSVRAGIIGEVGISSNFFGDPADPETKILIASAQAQTNSGAPMNIHIEPEAYESCMPHVIRILATNGVDFSRVILSHAGLDTDLAKEACYRELARQGFNLEFDYFSNTTREYGRSICSLIAEGYVGSILISHDICCALQLKVRGGWGYDYLLNRGPKCRWWDWTWHSERGMIADNSTTWLADVNGDGQADLISLHGSEQLDPGYVFVGLSRANGGFTNWTWKSEKRIIADNGMTWVADVNGDGKADLISQPGSGQDYAEFIFVWLGQADGSFANWAWQSEGRMIANSRTTWLADVNGDGQADLISQRGSDQPDPGYVYIGLGQADGSFTNWTWDSETRMIADNSMTWLADVNGDGKADLISQGGSGWPDAGWMFVGLGQTNGSFERWTWDSGRSIINDDNTTWVADVNGDGKVDLISQCGSTHDDAGKVSVALSADALYDHLRTIMADNPTRVLVFKGWGGKLSAQSYDPAVGFDFTATLSPGADWLLQFSTNLAVWENLTNVSGTGQPLRIFDAGATNRPCTFYRALAQ